jgi:tetratricopeptide (TPR) repeat protein
MSVKALKQAALLALSASFALTILTCAPRVGTGVSGGFHDPSVPDVQTGAADSGPTALMRKAYRDGDYDAVFRQYETLIAAGAPDSVKYRAAYLTGQALLRRCEADADAVCDYQEPVRYFTVIPDNHPDYAFARHAVADICYSALGDERCAIDALNSVILVKPKNSAQAEIINRSYVFLGFLYYNELGYENALALAVTALRKVPEGSRHFTDAQLGIGWVAQKARQWGDSFNAGALAANSTTDTLLRSDGLFLHGYAAAVTGHYVQALKLLLAAEETARSYGNREEPVPAADRNEYGEYGGKPFFRRDFDIVLEDIRYALVKFSPSYRSRKFRNSVLYGDEDWSVFAKDEDWDELILLDSVIRELPLTEPGAAKKDEPRQTAAAVSPKERPTRPALKINGKENPDVYLQSLDIQVDVTGNIASTRHTMVFKNKTGRILEGELTFPLPDGRSVTCYALDINGKMREAVPLEKAKATRVFEEIEQRRVDPGLLERLEGNNFRTRVYPIPAGGTRTISIGYEEELKLENGGTDKAVLHYNLPLDYPGPIENFTVKATVWKSGVKPAVPASDRELRFDRADENYTAVFARENYRPAQALNFALPAPADIPQVMMQPVRGGYCFFASVAPKLETRKKRWDNELAIIWDVSLSGSQRDMERELEMLDIIFAEKKDANVHLYFLNNTLTKVNVTDGADGAHIVGNGNWDGLRNSLENAVFDGGTDFSKIDLSAISGNEILFFSDGISTLSDANFPENQNIAGKRPIHCVVSSVKADYGAMRLLAGKTNGKFVNLSALSSEELKDEALNETPRFLGTEHGEAVSEVYPRSATSVRGNFSLSGISGADSAEVTMLFGFGDSVEKRLTVKLDAKKTGNAGNAHRLWAQKKIAELDLDYEKNRAELAELGQRFGIVTRNTSLIVLETVDDYVRYNIEPPPELSDEYRRRQKGREDQRCDTERNMLKQAETATIMIRLWRNETNFSPWKPKKSPALERALNNSRQRMRPKKDNTGIYANEVREAYESPVVSVGRSDILTVIEADKDQYMVRTRSGVEGYVKKKELTKKMRAKSKSTDFDTSEVMGYLDNPTPVYIVDIEDPAGADPITLGGGFSGGRNRPGAGDRQASGGSAPAPSPSPASSSASADNTRKGEDGATAPAIAVKPVRKDNDYLNELTGKTAEYYKTYLKLREVYASSPAFYFDMADWFYTRNDKKTALLILTSIADLDLEDASLYRMLGYRFKEYGEYALEKFVCKKLVQWRPLEPQSHRDYALALADNGEEQAALDSLYGVLTKTWPENIRVRSRGIEEAVITEINRLLAKNANLSTSKIDKSVITEIPLDIRVVINWNTDNTDIDLHVKDPYNEECSYPHVGMMCGGRVSVNNVNGYGPEQVLLKNAAKGKYRIYVNYYGDRRFTDAGPTIVMVEIYTKYAGKDEQRRVVCLRMSKEKRGVMVKAAEFDF